MARRLHQRLEGREGHLGVHFDVDEDHAHRSEAENVHNDRLLVFFGRFLR